MTDAQIAFHLPSNELKDFLQEEQMEQSLDNKFQAKPSMVMPAMNSEEFSARLSAIKKFVSEQLEEGIENDYGILPSTKKKTLLQPGAQKFERFFGLTTESILVESTVDPFGSILGTAQPFYYYRYETKVFKDGILIHVGHGSANSQESKWGYKWVDIELFGNQSTEGLVTRTSRKSAFVFQIEKAETTGQYAKPQEYWDEFNEAIKNGTAKKIEMETKRGMQPAWEIGSTQVRVANDDVSSQTNTIQKIAKKRSYVDGIIYACAISDLFTQDMEDFDTGPQWNPVTGAISTKTETNEKGTDKPVETKPPTPAAVASSKPLDLPPIAQPRELPGSPQPLKQQAPQAPSKVQHDQSCNCQQCHPEPTKKQGNKPTATQSVKSAPIPVLFDDSKKEPEKQVIKKQSTLEEKTQTYTWYVPSQILPPDGMKLTDTIGHDQLVFLQDECKKRNVGKEWVKRFVNEYFDGRAVKAMNFVQLKITYEEFLVKGLQTEKQIKSIQNLANAAKLTWESVENWVQDKFNKPVKYLYPSEVIQVTEYIHESTE